jgi:hypothetical protein
LGARRPVAVVSRGMKWHDGFATSSLTPSMGTDNNTTSFSGLVNLSFKLS